MMQNQSTDTVLMIRPASFKYNVETAQSNAFQKAPNIENPNDLALQEFDSMVAILRAEGVNVWVEEDPAPDLVEDGAVMTTPSKIFTEEANFTQAFLLVRYLS